REVAARGRGLAQGYGPKDHVTDTTAIPSHASDARVGRKTLAIERHPGFRRLTDGVSACRGDEVYEKDKADALEAELKPLVGGPIVAKMFKYNTDPAHNPQPPRQT